jgi:hypothetical protein
VKNVGLLITGGLKVLGGISVFVLASLNFTNPIVAFLEVIARLALKNAISGVIWMINDGLRDILASFDHVDPVVKVWVDISEVVLDIVAIMSNIISIGSVVKAATLAREFMPGFRWLGKAASDLIKDGVPLGPMDIKSFTQLGALSVGGLVGVDQFISDANTLATDWRALK